MRVAGSSLVGILLTLAWWDAASSCDAQAEESDKKVSLVLFTSKGDKTADIEGLLDKVKAKYQVDVSTRTIEAFGEEKLKFDVLLKPSVEHKIKINQSKRGKQLYTHLVVYIADEPRTFYPQNRKGDTAVSIEQFLNGLLQDKILTVHDIRRDRSVSEKEEVAKSGNDRTSHRSKSATRRAVEYVWLGYSREPETERGAWP